MPQFCVHCGVPMHEEGAFCHSCGKPKLGSRPTPNAGYAAAQPVMAREPERVYVHVPAPQPEPPKRRIAIWFLIPLLIIVIIWGLNAVIGGLYARSAGKSAPPLPSVPFVPRPHTVGLAEKAFTVAASKYSYYRIDIPDGATDVRVDGRFSATGGSGNDIEVVIADEDAFVNWQNGHSTKVFYSSGKVTQDTLDRRLPSGARTYYVVFSNTFSLMSPKAVETDLTFHYLK